MPSSYQGNIFFYDNRRHFLPAFFDIYDNRAFKTFGTDNMYQLLLYAREIKPDVVVINLQNQKNPTAMLENFFSKTTVHFPVIVLNPPTEDFTAHPEVTRYLNMPADFPLLTDMLESFTHGNKAHHIMLLDSYSPHEDALHTRLNRSRYDYFEVHNADSAALYLQKNQPDTVLIEYSPEFIAARHTLNHPRIFYVDRHDNSAEIEKILS
ncbi:MAG: hypothetical protein IKR92_01695 [Alphaproteobacteria bacterium]|nr:hypothetical protein [Alphaproteobacteria bacterium]